MTPHLNQQKKKNFHRIFHFISLRFGEPMFPLWCASKMIVMCEMEKSTFDLNKPVNTCKRVICAA